MLCRQRRGLISLLGLDCLIVKRDVSEAASCRSLFLDFVLVLLRYWDIKNPALAMLEVISKRLQGFTATTYCNFVYGFGKNKCFGGLLNTDGVNRE